MPSSKLARQSEVPAFAAPGIAAAVAAHNAAADPHPGKFAAIDLGGDEAQEAVFTGSIRRGTAAAMAKISAIRANTVAQLRVLSIGDSMEAPFAGCLVPDLMAAYGSSGHPGNVPIILSGGAALGAQDFTLWPTGENWVLPSAGTITYSGGSTTSINADRIIIPYLIASGAGSFKVQTSDNGAAFADEAGYTNVSANGSQALGAITLNKTAGGWRAQVVGLTGSVKFFRPIFRRVSKSGVEWYQMGYSGITLEQFNTTDSTLFAAALALISPDLITWNMREVSSDEQVAGLPAQLTLMQARFDAVVPNASWLFSGAPPMQDATQDARTVVTNEYARQHASARNVYFFDQHKALVSWESMHDLGYDNGDGVHLSTLGARVMANAIRHDSGLTAEAHLGGFGYNTSPSNAFAGGRLRTIEESGVPGLLFMTSASDGRFWFTKVMASTGNNRGLSVKAAALNYPGSEALLYGTALEFVDLTAYLGAGNAGLAVGGATPGGVGRITMPPNGTTALATGWAWGDNTFFYHSGNDQFVFTGAPISAPAYIGSTQALTGAGAANLTTETTKITSSGALQAISLADGVDGQTKIVMHDVAGGSFVLTATTKTGWATFTSTAAGESIVLKFVTTRGWIITGGRGGTIA